MNDWPPTAAIDNLRSRAELVARIRHFFDQRGVIEVSTPCMTASGVTDVNIDSIELSHGGFLRTSPEYWHKRLLAAGFGDLYELGPVFRAGEAGRFHQPEFTLLEWYRVGWSWQRLADEVVTLIQHCLHDDQGMRPIHQRSWNECFQDNLGIDALSASRSELEKLAIDAPPGCSHDMLLDYLFATRIQPVFEENGITIIHDYPATQAALARLNPDNPAVAERFEVFVGSLELANGYGELCDAGEQLERFRADNQKRKALGRRPMPIDSNFIDALQQGLPQCAGVALGVDRLIMAALNAADMTEVISFPPPPPTR